MNLCLEKTFFIYRIRIYLRNGDKISSAILRRDFSFLLAPKLRITSYLKVWQRRKNEKEQVRCGSYFAIVPQVKTFNYGTKMKHIFGMGN